MFLLVGPELVNIQAQGGEDWKFTQNWIAYEVGLACALDIDVWVVCSDTTINFPVPYLNNYVIGNIKKYANPFYRQVLQGYLDDLNFRFGYAPEVPLTCPNEECGAKFNFHNTVSKGKDIICPTCLKSIPFPEGWLLR